MFARDSLYMIANHTAAINEKHEFCTDITERLFSNAVSALYLSQYTQQYLDNLHQRVSITLFIDTL